MPISMECTLAGQYGMSADEALFSKMQVNSVGIRLVCGSTNRRPSFYFVLRNEQIG